jgi:Cof subfamily protein (haloacid dehalogenase superfamily)
MIKLIALDIDGTLFNSNRDITEITRNALLAAHDKGITLMMASGRSIHGLRQLALRNGLPLDNMVTLAYNGACVAEGISEEILFETPIEKSVAQRLIKELKKMPITVMVPYHHELYVEDFDGLFVRFEMETECFTGKLVTDLSTLDFDPNKVILTGQKEDLDRFMTEVAPRYSSEASFVFTGSNNIDVAHKNIDKGTTLKRYCELKGIDRMEVLAFGDNYNDLTMIEYAGLGVAMGNAVDSIKEIADRITGSNDEDGIAMVINELL